MYVYGAFCFKDTCCCFFPISSTFQHWNLICISWYTKVGVHKMPQQFQVPYQNFLNNTQLHLHPDLWKLKVVSDSCCKCSTDKESDRTFLPFLTRSRVPCVDLTRMLFLQRKALSCSAEKKMPCMYPAHIKFKAGQGRMCYVMCWGLQHFIAVLHNRKPGTHCILGLKQQACRVLPPPLPCDTSGWHVTSPGVRSKKDALTVR